MMYASIFLLAGLIFVFLEFCTPGGLFAVLGAIAIVFSITLFISQSPSLMASCAFILFALSLVALIIWLALLMIRKTGQKNTLYLADDQEGYVGVHYDAKQIGKTAVATTDLGPSGFIQIDNVRYQALARGTYIDKGTEVIVVGGQGAHLIVKQKEN